MAPGLCVLHVRRAQSAKRFRKEIFSQGSRQDGRGGSGFINVLRAGALSPLVERRKATSPGRPRKAVGTHSHHSSEVPLMTMDLGSNLFPTLGQADHQSPPPLVGDPQSSVYFYSIFIENYLN